MVIEEDVFTTQTKMRNFVAYHNGKVEVTMGDYTQPQLRMLGNALGHWNASTSMSDPSHTVHNMKYVQPIYQWISQGKPMKVTMPRISEDTIISCMTVDEIAHEYHDFDEAQLRVAMAALLQVIDDHA